MLVSNLYQTCLHHKLSNFHSFCGRPGICLSLMFIRGVVFNQENGLCIRKIVTIILILKNPQIMAPFTNAAKMIQEAEESGKSLLEVSLRDSFLLSTKTK